MKPMKSLFPVSIWLMRIGLLLFAFTNYTDTFRRFNLEDLQFYVAAIFIIAAVLIFISGFIYKASYTVLSALAITIISVYHVIVGLDGGLDSGLVLQIIIASIGILFLSKPSS
jgi:hypothetical protein